MAMGIFDAFATIREKEMMVEELHATTKGDLLLLDK